MICIPYTPDFVEGVPCCEVCGERMGLFSELVGGRYGETLVWRCPYQWQEESETCPRLKKTVDPSVRPA